MNSDTFNLKNPATYPSIYGIEETRKLAEKVHVEAVGFLSQVEKPTEILREIAEYALNRQA